MDSTATKPDRPRVLVVDDTAANRYAVARTLRTAGFEVLEAERGEQALQLVRAERPDLVVLDVRLPDMLGFEVTQRLRAQQDTENVGILHLSATFTDSDAQAYGLGAGADAYLLHPFDSQVLVATVRALLRMRAAERRTAELLEIERRTRTERARLMTDLEQALRARDEFISIASHDIKSPLNTLQLSLTIVATALGENGGSPNLPLAAERLRIARGQAQQIVELLESLLDVSRISSGRLEIQCSDMDLAELAHDVVDRMRDQFAAAGCELQLDVAAPVNGHWDRIRLEQVMSNLFANALKYGSGRPVSIAIGGDAHTGWLEVRDQGVGIAREDLPRIFKQFERLRADGKRSSFGLGLWIVQRIVDALSGSIHVESEPGRGSTFRVELPRDTGDRGGMSAARDH